MQYGTSPVLLWVSERHLIHQHLETDLDFWEIQGTFQSAIFFPVQFHRGFMKRYIPIVSNTILPQTAFNLSLNDVVTHTKKKKAYLFPASPSPMQE